jgi:hypothetical protein
VLLPLNLKRLLAFQKVSPDGNRILAFHIQATSSSATAHKVHATIRRRDMFSSGTKLKHDAFNLERP